MRGRDPGRTRVSRGAIGVVALAAVTLAVTSANVWMIRHRQEGYIVDHVSDVTLYSPAEALRIAGFERGPGVLVLRVEPQRPGEWEILGAGEEPDPSGEWDIRASSTPIVAPGPHPEIRLEGGVHRYRLTQRGLVSRTLELTVLHQDTHPAHTSVLDASVPIGDFARRSLAEQTAQLEHYTPADIAAGRRVLAQMHLPEGDTRARIERLMEHLKRELDPHRGVPTDEMTYELSALAQYEAARAGRGQVFCANFAQIYSFFATLAGIPTREVSIGGERDGVSLGGHTFNESYIQESAEWAYVDLTLDVALVQTSNGSYLNAIELARLHELRTLDGLTASVMQDGDVQRMPYAVHAPFARTYLHGNATYVYQRHSPDRHSFWGRARRMTFEPDRSWAADASNARFHLKTAALLAQLLVGLAWTWAAVRWLAKRRRTARKDAPSETNRDQMAA